MGKTTPASPRRTEGDSVVRGLAVSRAELEAFCLRWRIRKLAFYGSVLAGIPGPDEPVQCIVEFEEDEDIGLAHYGAMVEAMEEFLGHRVLAVTRNTLDNQWGAEARRGAVEAMNVFSR